MSKLNREQEDEEIFIEDYTNQIRLMSTMSDIQIKVLLKRLMLEDPEWFDLLRTRFRRKQMRIAKDLAKQVSTDLYGSIQDLARKVA